MHNTYFSGVVIAVITCSEGNAVLRYTGFAPQHRVQHHRLLRAAGVTTLHLETERAEDAPYDRDVPTPFRGDRGADEKEATDPHCGHENDQDRERQAKRRVR